MKDMNFIQLNKAGNLVKITDLERRRVLDQLEADSKFLQEHNIMDYSLFLVTEKAQDEDE